MKSQREQPDEWGRFLYLMISQLFTFLFVPQARKSNMQTK
jgi:hypothetical protein